MTKKIFMIAGPNGAGKFDRKPAGPLLCLEVYLQGLVASVCMSMGKHPAGA